MKTSLRYGLAGACTVLASAQALAQSQFDSLPAGDALELKMEGLNERYAIYIEHGSVERTPTTVTFWMLQVIPKSVVEYSNWQIMSIDCGSWSWAGTRNFAVKTDGKLYGTSGEDVDDYTPITEDSMNESIAEVMCEGKSFNLGQPQVSSFDAAVEQARAELKERFGAE